MTLARKLLQFTILLLPTLGYTRPVEKTHDGTSESSQTRTTRAVVYFGEVQDAVDDEDFYLGSESPGKRRKRATEALPQMFRNAYTKPGLGGDVIFTARRLCKIFFEFDGNSFMKSEILMAELRIFKMLPPKSKAKRKRINRRRVRHARVSIYQVLRKSSQLGTARLLDSKLVAVDRTGWVKFSVTPAMREWVGNMSNNRGLEVWIESARPGKQAAKTARRMKFVQPSEKKRTRRQPSLVIYFKPHKTKLSRRK